MTKNKVAMKRLDLAPELVERAKIAYAKTIGEYGRNFDPEGVEFRTVMGAALKTCSGKIIKAVKDAGLVAVDASKLKKRQRPVDPKLWAKLDEDLKEVDLSKIQLIRAALELYARSEETAT